MSADITTLEKLANTLEEDANRLHGLGPDMMRSVAEIIRESIGAPIMWPSRVAGAAYADEYYAGSNRERLVFNHGVKWAVEHYSPTSSVHPRYPAHTLSREK